MLKSLLLSVSLLSITYGADSSIIPEDIARDDIQQSLATDVIDSHAISSAVVKLRLKLSNPSIPLSEMAESMEEIAGLMKNVGILFREVGGGDDNFKLTNTIEFELKEIEDLIQERSTQLLRAALLLFSDPEFKPSEFFITNFFSVLLSQELTPERFEILMSDTSLDIIKKCYSSMVIFGVLIAPLFYEALRLIMLQNFKSIL